MGYLKKDISLEMLYKRKLLSSRAFTVCKQIVKAPTLETAINFYKLHGSFIKVRYCGNGTNEELIRIYKRPSIIVNKFNGNDQSTDTVADNINTESNSEFKV